MVTITLRNNFHNTQTHVHPVDGVLSASQVRRALDALCSGGDCQCSGDLGTRGPQDVRLEPRADGSYRVYALEEG